MLRSHLGTCRSLRLVPLIGLLTLGACTTQPPASSALAYRPPGQSQTINPIAVVGDSDNHRGFILRGDQARIYLANGVQVIAPPQKDLVELYGDINSCRYGGGLWDTNAYLACLHNAHDVLQFPNGKILAWAKEDVPWYHGTDEPSPSPSFPTDRSSTQEATSTTSPRPRDLTPQQNHVLQVIETAAGQAAGECGGEALIKHLFKIESHGVRCFAAATLSKSYKSISFSDIRDAVCSNPDALLRIPLITPTIKKEISDKLGCAVS